MSNLVYTGFMGCGKTTLAKYTAEKLKLEYIDVDEEIEKNENTSISEIFKNYGEEYFRDLESKYVKIAANQNNVIISTGGGVILREENIRVLRNDGRIYFINPSIETIIDRLKKDTTRPLLQNDDKIENIKELYDYRYNLYKKYADFIIDTDRLDLDEILMKVIGTIYGYKNY